MVLPIGVLRNRISICRRGGLRVMWHGPRSAKRVLETLNIPNAFISRARRRHLCLSPSQAVREWRMPRWQNAAIFGGIVTGMLVAGVAAAVAEARTITIAQQFGIPFLPLMVMRHERLIEKQAQRLGIGALEVVWTTFGSGVDMNIGILSGTLDFASGGVVPLLQIWDRTRGAQAVKGVAALGSLPLYLNTTNLRIRTVRDFADGDRIALPAVKSSVQALLLQMAAARAFGDDNYDLLDRLTVSLSHPQAAAALLAGTEITAHFTNPPFQNLELQDARVRRLLSSYDVLGGPATLVSLYASDSFRVHNPNVYRSVIAALREAMLRINSDKAWAAEIYRAEEKTKLETEFVRAIISDQDVTFTMAPQGIMKFAEFMFRTRAIKQRPASWRDVFFSEVHGEDGS
jgi:NitT/TauT family transport system substrate-binding protein